jgi:hypothetical protein
VAPSRGDAMVAEGAFDLGSEGANDGHAEVRHISKSRQAGEGAWGGVLVSCSRWRGTSDARARPSSSFSSRRPALVYSIRPGSLAACDWLPRRWFSCWTASDPGSVFLHMAPTLRLLRSPRDWRPWTRHRLAAVSLVESRIKQGSRNQRTPSERSPVHVAAP